VQKDHNIFGFWLFLEKTPFCDENYDHIIGTSLVM
jgi:hypothetical protein